MKNKNAAVQIGVFVVLSLLLPAGCNLWEDAEDKDEPSIWEYSFMTGGDAVQDSDWYFDGGYTGEYAYGYYMGRTDIAAPYLFTGDFTAEFEFYLKLISDDPDDNIYRYAFRLVDPNWEDNSTRRFFSLSVYYTQFPEHETAYYQFDQGNGSYAYTDYQGNVPGVTSGVNTCRMVREGDAITVYMNGTLVGTRTISASNRPSVGYAPLIHGHNSSDPADSNFYLRKVTVDYEPGERVAHDWTP